MSDLVSVIIPTFNRAYCLSGAIDSALAQTHRNVEVLVVDDGSTDNTRELMQQNYGNEPRVKYLQQANQGVSAARNTGLRQAQGEYIALLDSDDLWKSWKLEMQTRCLRALPHVGMIWSDMEAINPNSEIVHPRYLHMMYHAYRWFTAEQLFSAKTPLREVMPNVRAEHEQATLFSGDLFSPMVMGNLVHTSTTVLTRERFEKVREFDTGLRLSGEDYDFHLRTCRAGPVAFVDLATIQYQLGYADRLSQHTCQIAYNFLTTLKATMAREKDHIRLPSWMVKRALADSHSWLGQELLDQGRKIEAAGYFRQSLQHMKWQPRVFLQWVRCNLPGPIERTLTGMYQRFKPTRLNGRNPSLM